MEKIDKRMVSSFMKERDRFSHKGDFGHALLLAGSLGKGGAAVLSAKSVLRTGAGLLTVHIPGRLNDILQCSVPEAMCTFDTNENHLSVLPSLEGFEAVGAGPGLGLVGPASNYQALGDFHKWVLCFAMILGRLEIFTFLVVLTPTFWRR